MHIGWWMGILTDQSEGWEVQVEIKTREATEGGNSIV